MLFSIHESIPAKQIGLKASKLMEDRKVRLRFAPSPTGALHIGGVRTALYNYLYAKKHGGDFILRIEDTDQGRYVQGAEEYILEALQWCGLEPNESPVVGGPYGPYRQSERKSTYHNYALQLVENGEAYYAFDTPDELEQMRERLQGEGVHSPTYNASTRMQMRNSLTLSQDETHHLIQSGESYVIRLKVDPGQEVIVQDEIRGTIVFKSDELDDKVLLKADGMPTYHMANVVDDFLMKITHVVRGEEWLSSTAHHVLLYKGLGIQTIPVFAHLPLILKPTGKGKLSKRDGKKLGMPVFPLSWNDPDPEECFDGFREYGFEPQAVINFLAFLGWSPGTEQEIFNLNELTDVFSFEKVSKGGARFDFEKALWFNQRYLMDQSGEMLLTKIQPWLTEVHRQYTDAYLIKVCELMKERVHLLPEILSHAYYLFEPVSNYDEQAISKRFKEESGPVIQKICDQLQETSVLDKSAVESLVKNIIAESGMGMGAILPVLRLIVAGTLQGPDLFEMIALIGSASFCERWTAFQLYVKNLNQ